MSPRLKGIALLVLVSGAVIAVDPWILLTALSSLALVAWRTGNWRLLRSFLVGAILPIGIVLLVVWGGFVQAPPGELLGSDPHGGLKYGVLTTLRLAVLGAAIQTVLLAGGGDQVPALLHSWGIRKGAGIVIAGTFALLPEARRRLEQIVTARIARGVLGKRTWWRQFAQVPHVILPLMVWILNAAILRAEAWVERGTLARFDGRHRAAAVTGRNWDGLHIVAAAITWLIWAIQSRWEFL